MEIELQLFPPVVVSVSHGTTSPEATDADGCTNNSYLDENVIPSVARCWFSDEVPVGNVFFPAPPENLHSFQKLTASFRLGTEIIFGFKLCLFDL